MKDNEYNSPIECCDEEEQLLKISTDILDTLRSEPEWYQKEILARELKYFMSQEQIFGYDLCLKNFKLDEAECKK